MRRSWIRISTSGPNSAPLERLAIRRSGVQLDVQLDVRINVQMDIQMDVQMDV